MHGDVKRFLEKHADKVTGHSLDVGSYNVNGAARDALNISVTTDMRGGKGVDVVCRAEDLVEHFGAESFDSVVSVEALEHMEHWRDCIRGMVGVLKPGGWLVITMASEKKGYHAHPEDWIRFTFDEIRKMFPGCEDLQQLGSPSIGWVWKKGALGDLDAVEGMRPRGWDEKRKKRKKGDKGEGFPANVS